MVASNDTACTWPHWTLIAFTTLSWLFLNQLSTIINWRCSKPRNFNPKIFKWFRIHRFCQWPPLMKNNYPGCSLCRRDEQDCCWEIVMMTVNTSGYRCQGYRIPYTTSISLWRTSVRLSTNPTSTNSISNQSGGIQWDSPNFTSYTSKYIIIIYISNKPSSFFFFF